jgi:amino acid efflux transporter
MGWFNLRGIKFSGNLQTIIACSVGGIVVILALLAWLRVLPADPIATIGFSWSNVGAAAALAFWSFIGIEVLAHLSSEFKNPERDFPLAIIGGTLAVAGIYWLGSWLTLNFAGGNSEGQPAIIYLFDQLLPGYGATVIGVFGLLSCVAAMNIYLASAARMAWSMAQDGILPGFLKRLNSAASPANAILVWVAVSAVSISLTTLFDTGLEDMIQMANGVILVIYCLTMIAALKLLSGPQKLIPCIGASTCLVLMISLQASASYALVTYALLLLAGLIRRRCRLKPLSVRRESVAVKAKTPSFIKSSS